MKPICKFLERYSFDNVVGEIRFELDNESMQYFSIDEGNRVVYHTRTIALRLGDHATQREDRPVDKGGDGEHIDENEIINMFKYAWNDIIEMYNCGDIDPAGNLHQNRYVIQCNCYMTGDRNSNRVAYAGARPTNKTLWAVFMIDENDYTGKLDIIVVTIFRGYQLKHHPSQERILITASGNVKQLNN